MKKIIILAGNGELPYNVVKELESRKLDFFIITFKNNKVSGKLKKYNPNTRKHEFFVEKKLPPHSK